MHRTTEMARVKSTGWYSGSPGLVPITHVVAHSLTLVPEAPIPSFAFHGHNTHVDEDKIPIHIKTNKQIPTNQPTLQGNSPRVYHNNKVVRLTMEPAHGQDYQGKGSSDVC